MTSFFRAISNFALAALTATAVSTGVAFAGDAPVKIIDIGDSYIIGHGLIPAEAFPTKLQAAPTSRGHLVEVIDTGFKNTSTSGLLWLKGPAGQKLLTAPANHAVILELGGNDCTRFDVGKTRSNLDQIVSRLAKQLIPVLLVGTQPYAHCTRFQGTDYPDAYRQIFSDLAKKYEVLLYPNFKDGVSDHPELLQADNDHPNAEGEAIIVERILPSVEALIAQVRQQ